MYLLDANVFIEATRLYYAPDLAPAFWQWLGHGKWQGTVASIAAVKSELTKGGDDGLARWVKQRPASFWVPPTDAVTGTLAQLARWANADDSQYRQEAVDEFLGNADYQLVAHAKAYEATVVTREQPAPEAKKSIKIPDACAAMGVPYVTPFDMYRQLGMRLT